MMNHFMIPHWVKIVAAVAAVLVFLLSAATVLVWQEVLEREVDQEFKDLRKGRR